MLDLLMRRRQVLAGIFVCASIAVPAPSSGADVMTADAALGDHDATVYCDASVADPDTAEMELLAADLNADGVQDLVISLPWADRVEFFGRRGLIYVVYGPFSPGEKDLTLAKPDVVIQGAAAMHYFGRSVAIADINGDGTDDLLATSTGAPPHGQVYAFFGGALPAEWDLATKPADVRIAGESARRIGAGMAAGDLDGDGYADIAVAGAFTPPQSGILYGRPTWPSVIDLASQPWDTDILNVGASGWEARRLVQIEDLDMDGREDLLFGDTMWAAKGNFTGEVAIWLGRGIKFPALIDRNVDPPDIAIEGPAADSHTGGMYALGDVDGDGRKDVVLLTVRQPSPSFVNQIRVVLGRDPWPSFIDTAAESAYVIEPQVSNRLLGSAIDVADFDGDGRADIAASDSQGDGPGVRMDSGRMVLFFGLAGLTGSFDETTYPEALYLWGADAGDFLGGFAELLFLRDIDEDGLADVVVPAPWADGPGNIYTNTPGDILVLHGCVRESCCDLLRDDSIKSIDPLDVQKAAVLPLDWTDCYRWRHTPGTADPELAVLADSARPLVFYATPDSSNGLYVTKGVGGDVVVTY